MGVARPGNRRRGASLPSSFHAFFQSAANRVTAGQALPDGSVVRFDLTQEDGTIETFALKREDPRVILVGADEQRPDCHLRCSGADFRALIDGQLDPEQGYLSGRLVVTGDVGIVLDLRRVVLDP